jgi:4-amino-4-deoxy-L-arabinose transferase-like glycosyltransferase
LSGTLRAVPASTALRGQDLPSSATVQEPAVPAFAALVGPATSFTLWQRVVLGLFLVTGAAFRLFQLSAEGFADDEVHKWLAAMRYLHGDFGGDDVEHPMVMKLLIAGVTALAHNLPPETLTRLPNVLASVAAIWLTAELGRRLFGPRVGLLAAGVYALSTTAIGYGRVAKEDTLLGMFLLLLLWCLSEAFAAARGGRADAQRRWETGGAVALGLMFASKYFLFLFPVPLLVYAGLRRVDPAWHVPLRRWLVLIGIALGIFVVCNWVVFLPSTWDYLRHYIAGDHLGDRASSETMLFMGELYNNMGIQYHHGTPIWFHPVFAMVKLAPLTTVLVALGVAYGLWKREPAHRVLLLTVGWFFVSFILINAKYARYFIPLLPLCVLLAVHVGERVLAALAARANQPAVATWGMGVLALALLGPEAAASASHAPHYRLYVNALGGGDERLDYFFPHCDYFDAGVREAVQWIAQHSEPHAQVASETPWLVRYYADLAGREDLTSKPLNRESACHEGGPCYVLVQPGRLYGHNRVALEFLEKREAVDTVTVGSHGAARVYRLAATDVLFP